MDSIQQTSTTGTKTGKEATQFKPGNHQGGRPKGSRDKLQRDFLKALSEDFEEGGKEALKNCREQNPAAYIKAIASLMPKEIEVTRPLQGLSDDDLARIAEQLRDLAGGSAVGPALGGSGNGASPAAEQVGGLSTLQ